MSKLIKLNGKHATGHYEFAIVDDDLFDYLSQWRWKATPRMGGGHSYAVRNQSVNGKYATIRMHRVVLGYTGTGDVDHINHNSVDNRRANLRVVTRSENISNRKPVTKTGTCERCGKAFEYVAPAGHPRRYCSIECRPRKEGSSERNARLKWQRTEGVEDTSRLELERVRGWIVTWLDGHPDVTEILAIALRDVVRERGVAPERVSATSIGRIMRRLGWVSVRRGPQGGQRRAYVRP